MDIKLLHDGMKVYIDPRCSATEKTHGLIKKMMKLMGTCQTIEYVNVTENYIEIDGHTWNPKDFSLPPVKDTKPLKKQTPVLFDSKELVL